MRPCFHVDTRVGGCEDQLQQFADLLAVQLSCCHLSAFEEDQFRPHCISPNLAWMTQVELRFNITFGLFTYLLSDLLYVVEILTIEAVYKYPIAYPLYFSSPKLHCQYYMQLSVSTLYYMQLSVLFYLCYYNHH